MNWLKRLFSRRRRYDALGAQRGTVVGAFVRQGMWLTIVGITIGLVIAFATLRFMSALLYGVSAHDPTTYITITCAVVIAALLACYLPSRRAAEVDQLLPYGLNRSIASLRCT